MATTSSITKLRKNNLAILILAAGTSSRLGQAKQLIALEGESLIFRSARLALELSDDVYVVLGDQEEACQGALKGLSVQTCVNPNYQQGIGSSIAYGISQVKNCDRVLIILCDQPFIPLPHYKALIACASSNLGCIVASKYDQHLAVPAIFPKNYFDDLLQLRGNRGAKFLLYLNHALFVELDRAYAVDIDTKEDWLKYSSFKN